MELLDLIANAHAGHGLDNIGGQFGLDRDQTQAAIELLAPTVAAGLRRNAGSPQGMIALIEALQSGKHERYLDDPDTIQFDQVAGDGNKILGHVFGSKDVSRGVAMHAAGQSGIGNTILKQLLPIIASMVLGALTRKLGSASGAPSPAPRRSGGDVSDVLGEGSPQSGPAPQRGGGGLGDILGEILGGGSSRGRYRAEEPDLDYDEDAFARHRDILEDTLGRGTPSGSAADGLLDSVERHIRQH